MRFLICFQNEFIRDYGDWMCMKGKQERLSELHCWNISAALLQIHRPCVGECSVGGLLFLLDELLSSLAHTFILLWKCSTAAALHFMHSERSAK